MTYGYARVSSRDQNEARQLDALHAAGVETVYMDKQSGKDFDRPQYKRLLRRLKRDDLLYIKSIDRLGRNYDEIIEQWRALTKDRSFVAENERANIRQRQAEGIAAAKARGVRFGRPAAQLPDDFEAICQRWQNGEITCAEAARMSGMPCSSFRYRYQREAAK